MGASRSLTSKTSKRRSKTSLEGTAKLPVRVAEMEEGFMCGQSVVEGNLGEHSTVTPGSGWIGGL